MNIETGCLEIVVTRRTSALKKILGAGSVVFTVLFLLSAFMFSWVFVISAVIMGVAAYLIWQDLQVDYEYVYVERELRISKIMRKSSRRELAVYDLHKLEILAPDRSHELDRFRHREGKTVDYSSRDPEAKDLYRMYLSDGSCLLLNLSGEYADQLIRIMKQYAPNKVYTY